MGLADARCEAHRSADVELLEGDPLRFTILTPPNFGTLVLQPNGNFTYTPRPNFSGADFFRYRVNDGRLDSPPATAAIFVSPLPPPPSGRPIR